MIDKKEDNENPSIKLHGIHESISTISLENVDQYLKQLEAQKLEAKSNISSSFMELTALLVAREKQLLRQVDVMHDHLILCLQSRQSLVSMNLNCCDNAENTFEVSARNGSTDSCKTKASPGIKVSLDTNEMQRQISVLGKVEVTGSSFMHLSEDNESFDFPFRVQSYQETCEDHMLLYKSLDAARTGNCSTSTTEPPDFESLVIEVDKEAKSADSPELDRNSNCTTLSIHNSSVILESNGGIQGNADPHEILDEDNEHFDKKEMAKEAVRRFSEERPEDVRHWMREILHQTNPEPTANDSDPERFDLFTVLKCSLNKEEFHQGRLDANKEPNHASYLAALNLLQQKDMTANVVDLMHQSQQENLPVEAETNECFLVD